MIWWHTSRSWRFAWFRVLLHTFGELILGRDDVRCLAAILWIPLVGTGETLLADWLLTAGLNETHTINNYVEKNLLEIYHGEQTDNGQQSKIELHIAAGRGNNGDQEQKQIYYQIKILPTLLNQICTRI